jgi:hypothetical protein
VAIVVAVALMRRDGGRGSGEQGERRDEIF